MENMREKLESLNLVTLKDLAKHRGIKGSSVMKKADLIERLLVSEREQATLATDFRREEVPIKREVPEKRPSRFRKERRPVKREEAKDERTEARSERTEARSERTEVRSERTEARSEGPEARSERAEVRSERSEARSERQEVKSERVEYKGERSRISNATQGEESVEVPSGEAPISEASGILEVMQDGFGFIRCENYLPGENDVYVAPNIIRRFNLKTGDILRGVTKGKSQNEKFAALTHLEGVNGYSPEVAASRGNFENMTPIFPNKKLTLESPGASIAMRIMDLICPIGKGQRGMIVSPPKAGKTTLLKEVAQSIRRNYPDIHLIVLLIDERPEEVTDIKEFIEGPNAEVIYSTFDELPEHHKRVSEMVIERARRLVEHKQDVMILLDSITRLARAYNQVIPPSGRTLSGGLDPAALHMPKRFFGAARNMREGGSLTILATALIETGSKMDDVVYEEFKGTGNMELILDRKLQEKRIFPAINIQKSSTRREDLLLSREELDVVNRMRRSFNSMKADEMVDQVINLFSRTRTNADFVRLFEKQML